MQNQIKFIFLLLACLLNMTCTKSAISLDRNKRDTSSEIAKILLTAIGKAAFAAIKDNVLNGVDWPAENECKFSFTHVGRHNFQPSGSIHSEWETEDSDINRNDEKLDGLGLQTDSTGERMSSAFYLREIRFTARKSAQYAHLNSCIVSITINCGNQVLPGGGYTSIGYQDMLNAWYRVGYPRGIYTESEPACVPFDNRNSANSFIGLTAKVDVLKCGEDRDCIQRNIEMY